MSTQQPLRRSAPEEQGIPSSAIQRFVDMIEERGVELHSLMLLRHGSVIAEGWWAPYDADHPHMLFSLSKSFTATAVGLAIAEGRLDLDEPVLAFFPDDAPEDPSEHLRAMRVRHLLSMSTGHAEDTIGALFEREDGNWARAFFARPVEHTPGTHFVYNSGASYMLSAIVQRLTGSTLVDYLWPRLFTPLGIEHATWETCPRGINTGGWGLKLKTEDIGRFGQLYLQRGVWNDQRLLPEAWVDEATSVQVTNGTSADSDWEQGYGYQFWRCRHGAYRGDGAFGQYCVVMPEQQAVLAITSGLSDMQEVLNLVWQCLLPAMVEAPLDANEVAHRELQERLARLELPMPQGERSAALADAISGRTFVFEPNEQKIESMSFDLRGNGYVLLLRDDRGDHRLEVGYRSWSRSESAFASPTRGPVAASGAWSAANVFEIKTRSYESPFGLQIVCRFGGDHLYVDTRENVSFGPTEHPQLRARMT